MEQITWSEIEMECGGYRAGFVAIFKKYQGLPTDEKDGQGRTIKVTASSFARHIGIAERTFRRWIDQDGRAGRPAPRRATDLKRDVLRASRHEPDAVVDGIMDAPEDTQDRIFHELKLRRAGVDTSPANRKAAQAAAESATEKLRGSFEPMGIALILHHIEDATTGLRKLNEESASLRVSRRHVRQRRGQEPLEAALHVVNRL